MGVRMRKAGLAMNKTPLRLMAYRAIKEKIVNAEYRPEQFFSEAELVRELGMSRTPIREALNLLDREGLIRVIPKKGVFVRGIALSEIRQIVEFRCLVEPYVLRVYGARCDKKELLRITQAMETALDEGENDVFYDCDNRFHAVILQSAENRFIHQSMQMVNDQSRRIRIIGGRDNPVRMQETLDEHRQIMSALLDNANETAAQRMEKHLRRSSGASSQQLDNVNPYTW